ncbi:MAG: LapA family protein [Alphaproteobacteria bacterium]|nr:LapA family protein [Alphaproteobacteria bacterium]
MRRLWLLIGLPLVAAAAVFAANNRTAAPIDLWPFGITIDVPVFLLVLGTLAVGLLLGGAFVWVKLIGWKLRARRNDRRIADLERDVATLRQPPTVSVSNSPAAA